MWCLRRRPERELAPYSISRVGFPLRDAGMGLYRRVIVALVIKPVFTDIIGRGKTLLHIAKLIGDGFMDIADTSLVIDLHVGMRQCLINAHQSGQHFICYLDQFESLVENIGIE